MMKIPDTLLREIPHLSGDASFEVQCKELKRLLETYQQKCKDLQYALDIKHGDNIPKISNPELYAHALAAREERMCNELQAALVVHRQSFAVKSRGQRIIMTLCRFFGITPPFMKEYYELLKTVKDVQDTLYHPRSD